MIGLSEKGGGPKSVAMVDSSKAPGNSKVTLIKEGVKTESSNSLVDVVSTEEDKTTVTMTTATTTTTIADMTAIEITVEMSGVTAVDTTETIATTMTMIMALGGRDDPCIGVEFVVRSYVHNKRRPWQANDPG